MNPLKIGMFIANLRRGKNMTQEMLANKLGVSINAVSKWERGINLPDVSLYKDLCEVLGISVEELINGEKNVTRTKKWNNKILFFVLFIIFIGICFYNLLWKVNLVSDSDYLYDEVINYVRDEEFSTNPDSSYRDFNVFYSYYKFGIERKNDLEFVYMWLYNTSYYIEDEEYGGGLAISSGNSIPLKAIFKNDKLQEVIYPSDGSFYKASLKKMFPMSIYKKVIKFSTDKGINKLYTEVQNKKNIYYGYLNMDMGKIKLDDLVYDDLAFSVELMGGKCQIPVSLVVYKDNKYCLNIEYRACKKGKVCNSMLVYTKSIDGTYDYDIIEIIRHSADANNHQYVGDYPSHYYIMSGNGHEFVTDGDNKYLNDFLKSIDVDLSECAKPKYGD